MLERITSGIPGLDSMLGGGLPKGRCFVVSGNPGAGKTILGMQFLYQGAVKHGEAGLYVSLEENPIHLREEMRLFGWELEELEKSELLTIVDASPIRSIPGEVKLGEITVGRRDFSLISLLQLIKLRAEKLKVKRIVIDPLSTLIFQYPDASERRSALMDLFQALSELEATCIVTSELQTTVADRSIQLEEFLAQGVIILYTLRTGVKAIHIEKMRGVAHDSDPRPYDITNDGVVVFPEEKAFI